MRPVRHLVNPAGGPAEPADIRGPLAPLGSVLRECFLDRRNDAVYKNTLFSRDDQILDT